MIHSQILSWPLWVFVASILLLVLYLSRFRTRLNHPVSTSRKGCSIWSPHGEDPPFQGLETTTQPHAHCGPRNPEM